MTVTILPGDCRDVLATLPARTFQTCVTSPPYYALRDYGHAAQIGLEPTPDEYVAQMVAVFREVKRVLRDDGTLWLNIGDSYASGGGVQQPHGDTNGGFTGSPGTRTQGYALAGGNFSRPATDAAFAKPKDLLGIPWLLAFALRADGWYLRSEIIWHKPNPMPESVRDRPTKAHETVFLLTKAPRYFYDADAISEPFVDERMGASGAKALPYSKGAGRNDTLARDGKPGLGAVPTTGTRNARSVWTIATQPYSGAHFATMPPDLAERCIRAGSKPGDHVLDPFGGAGTTGLVADRLQRHATLIELNQTYATLAQDRVRDDAPLLGAIA